MNNGSGRREPKPGSILAVILASYLMIGIDMSIVNIALPAIRVNLGFSAVTLSWVINAYMLTYGGLLFLGGRAGDVLGRRRTLYAGIVIFTVASALGGLATAGWWLLAARAAQGVGAALIAPSTMALLTASFSEGEARNRALSIYATAVSFGLIIGLLLGGVLTSLLSWRWVLYVNVPVGIALLFAIPRVLPETEVRGGTLNVPSGAFVTLAIVALVYGLTTAASRGFSDPSSLVAFGLAMAFAGGFIANERRAPDPLVPMSLFSSRNRIAAYLGLLFVMAGNFGMFFFATQFLESVLHLNPVQTGLAFLPMAMMIMATARIVPRLLRRFSPRALLLVGTPMQALALLWLSRLGETSSYVGGVLGPMIVCGLAAGLCAIPLTSLALSQVNDREAGAASGLTQMMRSIGGSFGLAILATVFGIATGATGAAHSNSVALFVHGATRSFMVAAILAALGFVSALVLIRTPAEEHKSVVRRYLEMMSNGRWADARAMLHPTWTDHSIDEPDETAGPPLPSMQADPTAADAAGSLQIVIDRMIGEGDQVAVHGTVHRRHNGSDTNSRIMWFIRMQENKMAEFLSMREPDEVRVPVLPSDGRVVPRAAS